MKSRRIAWAVVMALAVCIVGGAWLYAQPKVANGTFGPIAANPAYVVVNTSTPVLFTAQITDPQLKKRSVVLVRLDGTGQPSDIVGRLRDDGRSGDVAAGDKTYSLRTNLDESTSGPVNFKVAARFKPGKWQEPEADDDDWDADIGEISSAGSSRRARSTEYLKKLRRYSLSDRLDLEVWNVEASNTLGITVAFPSVFSASSENGRVVLSDSSASTDEPHGHDVVIEVSEAPKSGNVGDWLTSNFAINIADIPASDLSTGTTADGTAFVRLSGHIPSEDPNDVHVLYDRGASLCILIAHRTGQPSAVLDQIIQTVRFR